MREDLILLIHEINKEFYGKLINENIETYVDKLLKKAEFILQYSNGVMVGCLAFYANDPINNEGFISFIGIKSSHRDKGLGKILLTGSISYLRKLNFKEYGLEVVEDNEKALNFYLREGFKIKEKRKARFYMVKKL